MKLFIGLILKYYTYQLKQQQQRSLLYIYITIFWKQKYRFFFVPITKYHPSVSYFRILASTVYSLGIYHRERGWWGSRHDYSMICWSFIEQIGLMKY